MYRHKLSSRSTSNPRTTGLPHPSHCLCTMRTHTRALTGRQTVLSDVNRFEAHCWRFEDICYHLGGPHTGTGDPHERRSGKVGPRENPVRFITYEGAASFPPFSERFDTRKAKGTSRKATIHMRQRMLYRDRQPSRDSRSQAGLLHPGPEGHRIVPQSIFPRVIPSRWTYPTLGIRNLCRIGGGIQDQRIERCDRWRLKRTNSRRSGITEIVVSATCSEIENLEIQATPLQKGDKLGRNGASDFHRYSR